MKQRGIAKPIMKEKAPLVEKPVTEPDYDPGYYVSRASRRLIKDLAIPKEDVPYIFSIAMTISKLFHRTMPSIYDVQAAVMMRNIQNTKEIAEGTKAITLRRPEAGRQSDLELADLWKSVAEVLVQRHDASSCTLEPAV